MQILLWILFEIILGFIPQAMGCAVLLFTFTKQPLRSKSFLITSLIFSAVAIAVRLMVNYGLIEFGFHTILNWLIFGIVAIAWNKFPVLQSTISIMLSGVLIVATELVVAAFFMLTLGGEKFDAVMNNTATIEGQITRALYGIPMNILFVAVALLACYLTARKRARASLKGAAEADSQDGTAA